MSGTDVGTAPTKLQSIQAIVDALYLDDVRPSEHHAKMHWEGRQANEASPRLEVGENHADGTLLISLRVDYEDEDGEFTVAYIAKYEAGHAVEYDPDALREFVERVAVMALIPYVRAALTTLTATFAVKPYTLPMVRAGQLVLKSTPPSSE